MRLWLGLLALGAAFLAGPAAAQTPTDTPEQAVERIFAEYDVAWGGPDIYSARTAALIARWQSGLDASGDLVDDLSDFDWFCECQDLDPEAFEVTVLRHDPPGATRAGIPVSVDLGWDAPLRFQRFEMVRENGEWRLDDLWSASFPGGLRAALRQAIAEQGRD